MELREVDVVVIGMGPGGEDAAGQLAQAGLAVVGIDHHLVGGECPYYGCIPSKMIIRAANLLAEARRVNAMAGTAVVSPDYSRVADRIRVDATDDWDDTAAVERFTAKGGTFVRGTGVLDGEGRVRVGDEIYAARRGVILATGTSPALPPIKGLAESEPWTNRDVMKMRTAPRSLAVMGGGAIGLELAQALHRFGTRVTVIEAAPRILAVEEPETSDLLTTVLRREGIDIHVGAAATAVTRNGHVTIDLADDTQIAADELLVAAGRTPNLRGIGLDTVGLDENARPTITVDDRMRVAGTRKLWAIGDIAGRGAFTHMAVFEAGVVVDDVLGSVTPRLAHTHAVSRVTFTDPEVGSVGLTEQQARDKGHNVRVGLADGASSTRGWIHGEGNEGLIKLIEDADRGVLIGATVVGPHGGEALSLLNLAVHAAVPVSELRSMIYAYPTFYRGTLDALRALGS